MKIELEKPFLIVVEGKDDEAVVRLLLEHMRLNTVQVLAADGKDKIRSFVIAVSSLDGFRNAVDGVAIIRDADRDHMAASRSCEDSLAGIQKRTAHFVLPGYGNGILEDLCLQTLQGRTELACVDGYLECLGTHGITLSNVSKFRMRALWTVLDDGKSRDTEWAAVQGLLDPAHDAFEPLRQFLRDFTRV